MGIRIRLHTPRIRLDIARLLGLVCLLLVTAGVTSAQSTPGVSISDVTAAEEMSGDSGLFGCFFRVSLSGPSTQTIKVRATTQSGSATGDVDFVAGSIVLTFNPGTTSQDLQIFVKGDTAEEAAEDFFVNLSDPENVIIADGQAKGTIFDDDALVLVTQEGSQRAAALDAALLTKEAFPINRSTFFGSDNRMRIAVFAVGLKLAQGEPTSAVTATAEDAQGNMQPVTVEFVGHVPNYHMFGFTEIVVKLNSAPTTGDLKIRVTLHGETSNPVLVAVQP
jgi:Calx-beta domain